MRGAGGATLQTGGQSCPALGRRTRYSPEARPPRPPPSSARELHQVLGVGLHFLVHDVLVVRLLSPFPHPRLREDGVVGFAVVGVVVGGQTLQLVFAGRVVRPPHSHAAQQDEVGHAAHLRVRFAVLARLAAPVREVGARPVQAPEGGPPNGEALVHDLGGGLFGGAVEQEQLIDARLQPGVLEMAA